MKLQLARAVAAGVIIIAPGIIPAQERASNTSKPAHREEKASTVSIVAEDHLSLAGYFRDLASQEQALAESYEHIAALHKENAQHQGAGRGPGTEMESQFRRLAEIERKAAKLTASLADYQTGWLKRAAPPGAQIRHSLLSGNDELDRPGFTRVLEVAVTNSIGDIK